MDCRLRAFPFHLTYAACTDLIASRQCLDAVKADGYAVAIVDYGGECFVCSFSPPFLPTPLKSDPLSNPQGTNTIPDASTAQDVTECNWTCNDSTFHLHSFVLRELTASSTEFEQTTTRPAEASRPRTSTSLLRTPRSASPSPFF
jgi:hypothetical protein